MLIKEKGLIISGSFNELLAREKSKEQFEIGELLIAESQVETEQGKETKKTLLQVYDLEYGSQISQQNLELISGMELEDTKGSIEFMSPELRNYTLSKLKPLITINKEGKERTSKSLPSFFSKLRTVEEKDLQFLSKPKKPLFLGKLRSGSKTLNFNISIDGEKALSHHILIPATTGRGKSNLLKCMLWKLAYQNYAGILVLDPHDEYYKDALEKHPKKQEKIIRYSRDPLPGDNSLIFNLTKIKPSHFNGSLELSSPQKDALNAFYRKYGEEFIEAIVLEKPLGSGFHELSLAVLRRKIMQILKLSFDSADSRMITEGSYSLSSGNTTINDICQNLEQGRMVVIDTSSFDGREEILVGSLITTEIFKRYKNYRLKNQLKDKPLISIVLEEAPRVLGKEVLEAGPNIFSTIAREGRKFHVGLLAITQLPSLIPRQVLANMNTKIVLGIEMKPERQAIIDSAAQDLTKDDRAIASLDKGEAIVTTNFAPFALPIKIPLFETMIEEDLKNNKAKESKIDKKEFLGF